MNNPFIYGEIAVGAAFTGIKKELADLSQGLEPERIFLILALTGKGVRH